MLKSTLLNPIAVRLTTLALLASFGTVSAAPNLKAFSEQVNQELLGIATDAVEIFQANKGTEEELMALFKTRGEEAREDDKAAGGWESIGGVLAVIPTLFLFTTRHSTQGEGFSALGVSIVGLGSVFWGLSNELKENDSFREGSDLSAKVALLLKESNSLYGLSKTQQEEARKVILDKLKERVIKEGAEFARPLDVPAL